MSAFGHHGSPEMVWTAGHVCDDLGLLRVGDAWLKHPDDRAGAITPNAAKLNGLAHNRRIFSEHVRPEAISEDNYAGHLGIVILRSDEAPQNGAQSHHVEIGAIDYAAIDFAGLAQAENGEGDGREITKFAQRFTPGF